MALAVGHWSIVMQDEKIIGHRDGPVGHIIFNNPTKLNAVSLDMWERVHGLLREYAEDSAIRAVVVSGAGGKAFVSGADISKFESERANMEAQKKYDAISGQSYDFLYSFPKPTIAKITGYCIGGGMNLAGCCDLRFCNETARFGVPAAKLGLGYGFERIRRLAESIGLSKTLEVIYTGRQFSAQEALDMGFVQRVLADDQLDRTVAETTAYIANNAPLTIALAKAAAREIGKPEAQRDFDRLNAMVKACFDSQDYVEGRRAFMEKRKPNFQGK
jgi:enoyl-CoA hydratase/carnithine racemase